MFPQVFRVRQRFDDSKVADIRAEVERNLAALNLSTRVKRGQTVAITCGSRGVANIATIIKSAVDHFKSLGADPFVVPAMGSHGGGTAEGQREVLETYGVTEPFLGCPIRASMETVVVCQTKEGFPVHFDKHAFGADHVLVVNRVKPHTRFAGDIESGMMKMMLIGLGKHAGAKIYHKAIENWSFDQIVRSVAAEVIERCRVVAGLGVIENSFDETAKIVAALPADIIETDKALLRESKRLLPRLPFDDVDILIVDEIGKNISGTGMDTNVLGRKYNDHEATGEERPRVKRIIVRGLTEATHGNATGIGLAEFCLARVVRDMDPKITAINCITGSHPTAAMIPVHFETDKEVLEAALATIGLVEPQNAKLVWIHNTLDLVEIVCSTAYLETAQANKNLEILGSPAELPLEMGGMLPAFQISDG
ncbi:MAG: lactate racemase domain-containing protein [Pirellulales bacterium]